MGFPDPREMLTRMRTTKNLIGWVAFSELEPWGADVEDHRFGQVCATVANVGLRPKRMLHDDDFFPRLKPEPMPMTPEKMVAKFHMAFGTGAV